MPCYSFWFRDPRREGRGGGDSLPIAQDRKPLGLKKVAQVVVGAAATCWRICRGNGGNRRGDHDSRLASECAAEILSLQRKNGCGCGNQTIGTRSCPGSRPPARGRRIVRENTSMSQLLKRSLAVTATLALVMGISSLTAKAEDAKDAKTAKGSITGTVTDKDGK